MSARHYKKYLAEYRQAWSQGDIDGMQAAQAGWTTKCKDSLYSARQGGCFAARAWQTAFVWRLR